jgi:hypothetical protein
LPHFLNVALGVIMLSVVNLIFVAPVLVTGVENHDENELKHFNIFSLPVPVAGYKPLIVAL